MEVAVVEDDGAGGVGVSDGEVVVEDEFEGRVAGQVALHLDAAVDGGVDDVAWGVEQDVDLFVDVDEDVVVVALADRNWGRRWVDSVGAEQWKVADLLYVQQTCFALSYHLRGDQWFDVGSVGQLGVPEVDDFV